ncbi:MAG: serine/threonine kinase PknH [Mycobacterium sp.]|jgi:serine/threonine-protein kinase|nr:serine/threonine kinase PknH [Mycobacterium sp.]
MSFVRNPRIALGVTALAGLTALGGVGVAMSDHGVAVNGLNAAGASQLHITEVATSSSKRSSSSSSSSMDESTDESSSSSSSSSSKPPTSTAATTKLIKMLPPGFTASNCAASDTPVAGATATVDCTANPNGPSQGRFAVFTDPGALQSAFDLFTGEDQLQPCPGLQASPAQWSYKGPQGEPDGMLACGTYKGSPDLIWTENETLLLGDITGDSLEAIHDYWKGGGSAGAAPGSTNGRTGR